MDNYTVKRRVLLALWALTVPAFGQSTAGPVSGVVLDSASGKPVVEARIIARNLNKGADLTTVSDAEGYFAFTSLEPGRYEVTAVKSGFGE